MEKTIWVNGDEFILVEAEELSLDDEFMQYEPRTFYEGLVKTEISKAIQEKVKNFYCPKYAPSLTDDGKAICFVPGKKPAVERDYFRWEAWARRYCPERNSRFGTRLQYYAFLGVLMKKARA